MIKQLDLRLKTPVFNMVGNMISGLIQIKIFNRRPYFLAEFAKKINESLRANLCLWSLSRGFAANISYVSVITIWLGWVMGVAIVSPETAGLYGVSVIFLIQITDIISWILRQIIVLEGMMVSVERTFIVANLRS